MIVNFKARRILRNGRFEIYSKLRYLDLEFRNVISKLITSRDARGKKRINNPVKTNMILFTNKMKN